MYMFMYIYMWLRLAMAWLNNGGLGPHPAQWWYPDHRGCHGVEIESDHEDGFLAPPPTPVEVGGGARNDWTSWSGWSWPECLEWHLWAKLGPAAK